MKVDLPRTTNGIPPEKDVSVESPVTMTHLTIWEIINILCNLRFNPESKAGKAPPWWEIILANNFASSDVVWYV